MHVTRCSAGNWATGTIETTTNCKYLPSSLKYFIKMNRMSTFCVLAVLVLASVVSTYDNAIFDNSDDEMYLQRRDNGECETNTELKDMCERCAKLTRLLLAYRVCCNDEDGGRDWCQAFLTPGKN